ncbi:hypothetical protein [Arcobacter porcinus]|uniref:Lipoprotein n=1 Tax=Arcobacter porcinus TaxID=1935204 RepID=A0A5C2HEF4_9BACT|nr:hypothetical protein [Arcobacter porcinus]OCL96563.1 hypothetical protein AAX27_00613 [Aliarcobacter thereius]QEP41187.1 hypothetical protein APORC_1615 [Arcobacter porcinus]
MKSLLLVALLMLGLMFSGCASKHESGLNDRTSRSFAGNLLTSGNPVFMGVGALIGVFTINGIEETDMREQYNGLTDEQKQQYLDFMRPCMLDLHKIAMDKKYSGKKLNDTKRGLIYDKTTMHRLNLDILSKPRVWQKGVKHYSVYRNQCHPQAIQQILGEETSTLPVLETKETTENQTIENQTPTLNNTEKVEEKQENNN